MGAIARSMFLNYGPNVTRILSLRCVRLRGTPAPRPSVICYLLVIIPLLRRVIFVSGLQCTYVVAAVCDL